jgi:hypothetical protein
MIATIFKPAMELTLHCRLEQRFYIYGEDRRYTSLLGFILGSFLFNHTMPFLNNGCIAWHFFHYVVSTDV